MTPEQMVSRLLYRDGLMLVIDKPAGLAVHRGPNGGESLEDHFDALRFGLPRAPALAHRLDRDTSGCLVLGRHHGFHAVRRDRRIVAAFAEHPHDAIGGVEPEIGAHQRVVNLDERGVVELVFGDEVRDCGQRRG